MTGPAEPLRSLDHDRVAGLVNKLLHASSEDEVGYGRPAGLRMNLGRGCGEIATEPSGLRVGRTPGGGVNSEGPEYDAQHNRPTGRFWTGETSRVSQHLTRTARSQAARHADATVCEVEVAVVKAESSSPEVFGSTGNKVAVSGGLAWTKGPH